MGECSDFLFEAAAPSPCVMSYKKYYVKFRFQASLLPRISL